MDTPLRPAAAARPAPSEQQRRAELTRMRRLATGLLILASLIFLVTRILEQRYPWLAIVRATAEAAMVGAIADWFAVTALFHHPFGLKIPHTAIIPSRKDALGESLGRFVQNNFLTEQVMVEKLHSLQVGRRAALWLHEPANNAVVSEYATVLIGGLAQVARDDDVQDLIERTLVERISALPAAPLTGHLLKRLLSGKHQQELLYGTLQAVAYGLEENKDAIRKTISRAKPWWILVSVDDAVYQRLVGLVNTTLHELNADPEHPLHERFGVALDRLVDRLQHDPELIARGEEIKRELLAHPIVREVASSLWQDLKALLLDPQLTENSPLREPIQRGVTRLSEALLADTELQAKIDGYAERAVRFLIHEYGHEAQKLIAQTVRRWDPRDIAQKLELQVGKELQYIRINGTLVGGMVGLLIYLVGQVLERLLV